MPRIVLAAGAHAAFPADIVSDQLNIYAETNANYTISINAGPAFGPLTVNAGPPDIFQINSHSVTVTNTSPMGAGHNMLLNW